ncbi:MAG: peptide chain release factor N(5)-glutamine methyltransferase [Clostridiales bacterium]|nr:peptide chain release factor N(5)-glutamine methyltransferase [Clostridiales bacterium]
MNYREAYNYGKIQLAEEGIAEADLDARLLLEHVCHNSRNDLLVHPLKELTEEEQKLFEMQIETRKKHVPLQHITGVQEFMGLEFVVNENVLIPRQDTELLVEEAMLLLHDRMHILDMCTGSGCILLSLLNYSNDCFGVGVDLSEKALEVARENSSRLGIDAKFVQSDLFEKIEGKFDLILSNPPYIKTEEIELLMEEVKNHDPRMALDGKEDGLYFYKKIAAQAKQYLHRGGTLLFEIGYDQKDEVVSIMEQAGYCHVAVKKDLSSMDRVVTGVYLEVN